MKRSEFKDYIKETIVELLSEEEGKVSTDDPAQAAKLAKQGVDVDLTTEDIDDEDAAAQQATADTKDSVSVISRKLQDTTKEMKTTVNKWKQAEGREKERLLARLKDLTKIKKELEGLL